MDRAGEGGSIVGASGEGGSIVGASGEGASGGASSGAGAGGTSGAAGESADDTKRGPDFDGRRDPELVLPGAPRLGNPVRFCIEQPPADLDAEAVRQALRDAAFVWQRESSLQIEEVSCAEASEPNIVFTWHAETDAGASAAGKARELVKLRRDDASTPWIVELGDVPFTTALRGDESPPFDLVTVAAHAIGHALGLGHSGLNDALMAPVYRSSRRALRPEETSAVRILYPPSCRGPAIHPGIGYKLQLQHSHKFAQITGTGADAVIVQSGGADSDDQLFRFEATGDSYFKVISRSSELLWTVLDGSVAPGAPVVPAPDAARPYQEWCVNHTFLDNLAFSARHDEQAAGDASTDDGAPLEQGPFATRYEQFWKLIVGDCDGAHFDPARAYRVVARHSGKLASVAVPLRPLVQTPNPPGRPSSGTSPSSIVDFTRSFPLRVSPGT